MILRYKDQTVRQWEASPGRSSEEIPLRASKRADVVIATHGEQGADPVGGVLFDRFDRRLLGWLF